MDGENLGKGGKEEMKACNLVHESGIKRGIYPSKIATIRHAPYSTGLVYKEAIKRGWKIETLPKKEKEVNKNGTRKVS